MLFKAISKNKIQKEQLSASIGGGFIEHENLGNIKSVKDFPYPIEKGAELLRYTQDHNCAISEIVYKNALTIRSEREIDKGVNQLLETMLTSVYNGCRTEGILQGGLQ